MAYKFKLVTVFKNRRTMASNKVTQRMKPASFSAMAFSIQTPFSPEPCWCLKSLLNKVQIAHTCVYMGYLWPIPKKFHPAVGFPTLRTAKYAWKPHWLNRIPVFLFLCSWYGRGKVRNGTWSTHLKLAKIEKRWSRCLAKLTGVLNIIKLISLHGHFFMLQI